MLPHRLRQYRALNVFMQTGSVSRSAGILGISQPGVSKLLKSLEEEIGIALFDRTAQRLVPTAEAVRLQHEIEEMFAVAYRIERSIGQMRGRGLSEIRISALPMLGNRLLPSVISRFRQTRPTLHITLNITTSKLVRSSVMAGEVDVGFVHPGEEPLLRKALIMIPAVAVLPKGHALAGRAMLTSEDFQAEPFITLNRDNHMGDIIDRLFEASGISRRLAAQTNTFETACEMVAGGMGVSIVDMVSAHSVRDRVTVLPTEPQTAFPVEIVTSAAAAPSRLVEELVSSTDQALNDLFQTFWT